MENGGMKSALIKKRGRSGGSNPYPEFFLRYNSGK
jgi:hypothetical protein